VKFWDTQSSPAGPIEARLQEPQGATERRAFELLREAETSVMAPISRSQFAPEIRFNSWAASILSINDLKVKSGRILSAD
jgi:hypothetical protein